MSAQNQFSLLLTSLFFCSAAIAAAGDQEPRKPVANCSLEAESIRTVSTHAIPLPAARNSMTEKLNKIEMVQLFDHVTVQNNGRFKLKTTDSVVVIQDRPEFGGKAFNYATKETSLLYSITGKDPKTSLEYFTEIGQIEHSAGLPVIARYLHFLAIPEQSLNISLVVDERRHQNQLLGRRVHLTLSARDGQATASLNCVDSTGDRFSFAGSSRLK